MSIINDYFKSFHPKEKYKPYPKIIYVDGFSMSFQAGEYLYCSPRQDNCEFYSEVEIGYPSEKEDLIMDYCESPERPCDTVYGYVPVEIIDEVIRKHGGIEK